MSPFGAWFLVSRQFYYTITREEIFNFVTKKCAVFMRLVAFRKRLTNFRIKGEEKISGELEIFDTSVSGGFDIPLELF